MVFDFRSLYPSIIIAYNICYSSCVGLLRKKGEKIAAGLGCDHSFRSSLLDFNYKEEDIFIMPNGCVFVKKEISEGVLPSMLSDLIVTRIMLKKSMADEREKEVLRVKNLQQFGLKYLANVVYGYTAASYSGILLLSFFVCF